MAMLCYAGHRHYIFLLIIKATPYKAIRRALYGVVLNFYSIRGLMIISSEK